MTQFSHATWSDDSKYQFAGKQDVLGAAEPAAVTDIVTLG